MVIMVVFYPMRTTSTVIMVVFCPIRATCERSMVALQKNSMPAFKRAHLVLVASLYSQALLKVLARDSVPAAHPVLSSPAAERRINGRSPLSPFTDGSYLNVG
jgi:hypothetical protein